MLHIFYHITMYKNTLTDLLKTFSLKEIKDFREFLRSSYFNKRRAVTKLYEIISAYHPGYDSDLLTKESIFKKLFPDKIYNDSTLRVLIHYLTELAEKYLVVSKVENDKPEYSIQLQMALCSRKQYRLLEKNIKRSEDFLEKESPDAEDYYFYKYRLENEKIKFMYESNYSLYEKIINKPDWENVFRDFTNYYHVKSMIMYLNSLTIHRLYNQDFKSGAFTEMIGKIDPEDYEDVPVIKIYYFILKMITDMDDDSYFYKVKELIQEYKAVINKFDLMGAFVYLNQYCIKKISEGQTKFENESFGIYKEELQEKTYLMNDGTMAPVFYRNVVNTGLKLKELSWVKNFIHKYKTELSKRYRDNYFHYCLAQYEFCAGNYESSLELNSKIKYDELYMKLKSKTLEMQLLYETKAEESLLSSLENFRHFLNNNNLIPAGPKLQYSNFHKYLNKIVLLKNRKNKSDAGLLLSKLLKDKEVMCKTWLSDKIIEIS